MVAAVIITRALSKGNSCGDSETVEEWGQRSISWTTSSFTMFCVAGQNIPCPLVIVCGSIGQVIQECIHNALKQCRRTENNRWRSFHPHALLRGNHWRWWAYSLFSPLCVLYTSTRACVRSLFSLLHKCSHALHVPMSPFSVLLFSLNAMSWRTSLGYILVLLILFYWLWNVPMQCTLKLIFSLLLDI